MAVRPINMLSICTGGAGLDLGIELALPGARSVCLVEREAFAVAHLVAAMQQGLLDEAPVWSDARTFDGRAWRGAVDGLIGGIPCQPHSLAGKRLEREDPRDLWSTARRILVQSGAWFVLIENVGGMLSSGGAERVWRDLGRLGFACEVGLFTASEVGASHQRERTFILAGSADGAVAFPNGGGQPGIGIGNSGRGDDESRLLAGGHTHGRYTPVSDGDVGLFPPGPADLDGWRRVLAHSPDLEPAVRRMADGLAARLDLAGPHAARVDRLRLLGNGVVSLEAAYAFRTLAVRLAARGSSGADQLVRMMVEP